jgi:hypothetical protein
MALPTESGPTAWRHNYDPTTKSIQKILGSIDRNLKSARDRVGEHHAKIPKPPPETPARIIAAGLRDHESIAERERKKLNKLENSAKSFALTFAKLKTQAQEARNKGKFPNDWKPTELGHEYRGMNGIQIQQQLERDLSIVLGEIRMVRSD